MSQSRPVLVIVGAGSMGLAIARRVGPSHHVLISDFSSSILSAAEDSLRSTGHFVTAQKIDITSSESVASLATTATSLGLIKTVVVTAGVSNTANDAKLVYSTNLLGAALIIEAFFPHMTPGGSLTIIASVAGHLKPSNAALDHHFATAPISDLLNHPEIDLNGDPGEAYYLSKRGCILRARYCAMSWGRRSVRLNTVSPGVIMTPMIDQLMQTAERAVVQGMIDAVPLGRVGTPDDIAGVVAFLAGPDAGYINGADLVVDGGSLSTHPWREDATEPAVSG